MAELLLVLLAPALLLGTAFAVIEVRTLYGGCPTRQRYRWLHVRSGAPTVGAPGRY